MTGSTEPRRARHTNVALFVPHKGCPHRCSFCDQRVISGQTQELTPDAVTAACRRAADTMHTAAADSEIAFFGGSFTAVDPAVQTALLQAAFPFVQAGGFGGIRLSTRPDAIDPATLERLKRYGVTAVELGAQSMCDRVLRQNERGHTAADVRRAAALIHTYDVSLGLQMMTGLPGSDPQEDIRTAQALCDLQPDTMRIYPTVVVENTRLADWVRDGSYTPPTLEQAVELGAQLLRLVEWERGIPLIRMGLHAGGDVESHYVAGPYHPAFRELCESRLYRELALTALQQALPTGGAAQLRVAPAALSKTIGQKRENIRWLGEQGYVVAVCGDPAVLPRRVLVEIENT